VANLADQVKILAIKALTILFLVRHMADQNNGQLRRLALNRETRNRGMEKEVSSEEEMCSMRKKAAPLGNFAGVLRVFSEAHVAPLEPLANCTGFLKF